MAHTNKNDDNHRGLPFADDRKWEDITAEPGFDIGKATIDQLRTKYNLASAVLEAEDSKFDSLTGLLKREACEQEMQRIEREFNAEKKYREEKDASSPTVHPNRRYEKQNGVFPATPFSIILLDIDHFKKINDTYGHLAGDAVIQEVARRIKSRTREGSLFRQGDLAARWGGEEFLIVAIAANGGVANLAHAIREIIEEKAFVLPDGTEVKITVSAGIANYDSNHKAMLKVADQGLYAAKDRGRNKVYQYSPTAKRAAAVLPRKTI